MSQDPSGTQNQPSRTLLDTTAVLAVFFEERGGERVIPLLSAASISAVSLAEVVSIAVRKGAEFVVVRAFLSQLALEEVPFTAEHAWIAGSLEPHAKRHNLSLADRACLAVGLALNRTVVTADRKWGGLPLELSLTFIR